MEDLRVFEQEAQDALYSVRALAYGARRPLKFDALEAAQRYGERLFGPTGPVLTWIDDRTSLNLPPKAAKQIAWSIRESLTNVALHANASVVEVRLTEFGTRVRATVRDDGVGFIPERVELTPEGRGLGLLGNAERMAEIGGSFSIVSHPGEGTLVVLEAASVAPAVAATQIPAVVGV